MAKQLKVNIYSLAFGGRGVGKIDGKVCFVSGALPGEEVIFAVEKDTSRYIEGRVVKILVPSGDRVEPVCRYYGRCGGCFLQHLSYKKELFYKKEQLVQLIRRIAGKEGFECGDVVASPDCYHYITSVTLHAAREKYGYYERNGRTVVPITECPIVVEAINAAMVSLGDTRGKQDITLKSDAEDRVWSSYRAGQRFFLDRYRDTDISMSPRAFSQPNRYIAEKIIGTLEDWIGPGWDDAVFFDAYCGVGFFGFLVKQDFKLRVGIDASRMAINCAVNTVKQMNVKISSFMWVKRKKTFLRYLKGSKDTVTFSSLILRAQVCPGGFLKK